MKSLSLYSQRHNKALLRKIYSLALLNFRRARRYMHTEVECLIRSLIQEYFWLKETQLVFHP